MFVHILSYVWATYKKIEFLEMILGSQQGENGVLEVMESPRKKG
jgi:hypothetical protein